VQKEMPVKLIERTESQYRAKNRRKKNWLCRDCIN
jgi:hypothetical protein